MLLINKKYFIFLFLFFYLKKRAQNLCERRKGLSKKRKENVFNNGQVDTVDKKK
jgi:hypothetical protein